MVQANQAKTSYGDDQVLALRDVPLFAENTEVRANRIEVRIIDKKEEKVIVLEMS